MPRPSVNQRIKSAMRRNERALFAMIRSDNKRQRLFMPNIMSHSWWNALDRLQAKGLVMFAKPKRAWVGGYKVDSVSAWW